MADSERTIIDLELLTQVTLERQDFQGDIDAWCLDAGVDPDALKQFARWNAAANGMDKDWSEETKEAVTISTAMGLMLGVAVEQVRSGNDS